MESFTIYTPLIQKAEGYELRKCRVSQVVTMPHKDFVQMMQNPMLDNTYIKEHDEFGLGTIDFNKVIPMPDSIYQGDLGAREMQMYGKNNWYDWSIANWDTKWNAYGYEKGMDYSHEEALTFQTAWSAPHAVLEKLSEQFPEIEITHEWADEDIGMNCGRRMYSGGERCEEYVPESEKEAVEFAEGVCGFSGDDFQEFEAPTME